MRNKHSGHHGTARLVNTGQTLGILRDDTDVIKYLLAYMHASICFIVLYRKGLLPFWSMGRPNGCAHSLDALRWALILGGHQYNYRLPQQHLF